MRMENLKTIAFMKQKKRVIMGNYVNPRAPVQQA